MPRKTPAGDAARPGADSFNEAAARCRGKRTNAAGEAAEAAALQ